MKKQNQAEEPTRVYAQWEIEALLHECRRSSFKMRAAVASMDAALIALQRAEVKS